MVHVLDDDESDNDLLTERDRLFNRECNYYDVDDLTGL